MGCSIWFNLTQLFHLFFFILSFVQLTPSIALCPQVQSFALLQFKKQFSFDAFASSTCGYNNRIPSYPKLKSWKNGTDCCSWDGVECDWRTGNVIGLDLSCSWLYGTIHPNSTLFLPPHIQSLNLAYNDFVSSPFPSNLLEQFSKLTRLNLSSSRFSGQIPLEISKLSNLVSLDLSSNSQLRLGKTGFELLVQNLTQLGELNLFDVNISSVIPRSLLNLTSLTFLSLSFGELLGEVPGQLFQLPNLKKLDLGYNYALTGHFPEFNSSSPLRSLTLLCTNFSGGLPDSIGNLKSLNVLDIGNCSFSRQIPPSLGNLTQISLLLLYSNNFIGKVPPSLSNLEQLIYLIISDNHFEGPISSLFANATLQQLGWLSLSNNQLSGTLPSQVNGLSNLVQLTLDHNFISGTIPSWMFNLSALDYLDLSYNNLSGSINEFQSYSLGHLHLSSNKLHGNIPSSIFQLVDLTYLDLSSNNLSGIVSCSANSLIILNLSRNNLSGVTKQCLRNLSRSLLVLDLQKNNFYGNIPNTFAKSCSLLTVNLHNNALKGPVPESLVKCRLLQVLDLGNNKINDTFPHWLESLPYLHVLILQSNRFYGPITGFMAQFPFHNLTIFDISYNNFTGHLPTKYFKNFEAMRNVNETTFLRPQYMLSGKPSDRYTNDYYDSLTLTTKGSTTQMVKVQTIFMIVDLSNNNFEGEIPKLIGMLNSVQGLNLSHNKLTGHIPASLGDMRMLESLDLSSNKLVGEIPEHLTSLVFLEVLNLSHNQLTGPIPRGKQFGSFVENSYEGNLGLCGLPLPKKCGQSEAPQPPQWVLQQDDSSESPSGFDWKVTCMGYGCGLVLGLSMGYIMLSTGRPKWVVRLIESQGNKNGRRTKKHAHKS